MRYFVIICIILLVGCSRNKGPKTPSAAALEFPLKNSECSTGEDINETTSRVEFKWKEANDTETYELQTINLNTNIAQTISTASLSAKLLLEKGAPYSWSITTKNSQVNQKTESEVWLFYNAGAETTYAPFPAAVLEPSSGSTISKDINNEVLLDWSGADIDNDISEYEVYFSLVNPPETLVATISNTGDTEINVSVTSNTVYFWRVVTKDEEGNTSDSGIYEFKVF